MTISSLAKAYIRSLNGELIPMTFPDARKAYAELEPTGLVLKNGYVNGLTSEGRALAMKLKNEAHGGLE